MAGGGGLVIGTTGGNVVTRRVTGGRGFVTGMLGWEVESGREVMPLGGEGKDAGLTTYVLMS